MDSGKNKRTDYKRAFNEKAYDRLAITIPKGRKGAVEAHARLRGLSLNGYVNELIRVDMDLSEAAWRASDPE